jgi:site-specific DNA recombinase
LKVERINKEMQETVLLEIEGRRAFAEKYNINKLDYATVDKPFAGGVICGHCGSISRRKVWISTDDTY